MTIRKSTFTTAADFANMAQTEYWVNQCEGEILNRKYTENGAIFEIEVPDEKSVELRERLRLLNE